LNETQPLVESYIPVTIEILSGREARHAIKRGFQGESSLLDCEERLDIAEAIWKVSLTQFVSRWE